MKSSALESSHALAEYEDGEEGKHRAILVNLHYSDR